MGFLLFLFLSSAPASAADAVPAAAIAVPAGAAPVATPTAPACPTLFARMQTLSPDLANAYTQLQGIDPALIRGEKTPTWHDFEELRSVITELKAGKESVTDAGKLAELDGVIKELEASVPGNPALAGLKSMSKMPMPASGYQPNEYELKLAYQTLLHRLDKELPKELKIPGARIALDPRGPQLVTEARKYVQDLETKANAQFASSGFADEATYLKAVEGADDNTKKALAMLQKEDLQIQVSRPEGARWWTPKVGFQNQFVTHSSRGTLDNARRNSVEARYLGVNLDDYSKIDNELKPKYGYITPTPESKLTASTVANWYGDDHYILKLDKIRDRLTWTPGDSLNRAGYGSPPPGGPASWDQLFMPWSKRELAAPGIGQGIAQNKLGYPGGGYVQTPTGAIAPYKMSWPISNDYTEVQIWGPLKLDDVAIFEFKRTPPSGEFLQELLKRGIKIRDASKFPPVDWIPPK
jgi:hypothetical protein